MSEAHSRLSASAASAIMRATGDVRGIRRNRCDSGLHAVDLPEPHAKSFGTLIIGNDYALAA
jgi:hypothetical protein